MLETVDCLRTRYRPISCPSIDVTVRGLDGTDNQRYLVEIHDLKISVSMSCDDVDRGIPGVDQGALATAVMAADLAFYHAHPSAGFTYAGYSVAYCCEGIQSHIECARLDKERFCVFVVNCRVMAELTTRNRSHDAGAMIIIEAHDSGLVTVLPKGWLLAVSRRTRAKMIKAAHPRK